MNYRQRLLECKVLSYFQSFPCVLVVGARQVGKSTMLQHLFAKQMRAFTFDSAQDLYGAKADPDLFLRNNPPPLILDEIQYAPELVPAIKRYVDDHRRPGMFLITGSQQWEVMRRLSESLAGRVAIIELTSFALAESQDGVASCWFSDWIEDAVRAPERACERLRSRASMGLSPTQTIWRGAFPEIQGLPQEVIAGWMRGYVATYLQRDVRNLLAVRDETQFGAFLSLCAALTAQECNYSQLGRDIGLSTPTAQNWIAALKGTFQWLEIPSYSNNQIKRLSQKPKGYLVDTGLACYLLRLSSPDALLGHPAFGALFETHVVLDLLKQVQGLSTIPAFHHFRQHSGTEVDLIVEIDGRLLPVEIKAASQVRQGDTQGIRGFQEKAGDAACPGIVVYAGKEVLQINERCLAVPFDLR